MTRAKYETIADLPRCSVCSAPLRPYKAPLSKWPGTKAKVSSRPFLCSGHQYGKGHKRRVHDRDPSMEWDFTGHIVHVIPQEKVQVVRRLIKERFEGDDYLLITDALGIGDDID